MPNPIFYRMATHIRQSNDSWICLGLNEPFVYRCQLWFDTDYRDAPTRADIYSLHFFTANAGGFYFPETTESFYFCGCRNGWIYIR